MSEIAILRQDNRAEDSECQGGKGEERPLAARG